MAENISEEKRLEKILYQQEMYQKQMEVISQQMMMVENGIKKNGNVVEGITAMKENKEKELLIPIGDNIFVKVGLKSDKLMTHVGGGIFLEKDFDETIKVLNENISKLKKMFDNMQKTSSDLEGRLIKLSEDAESLASQQQ